MRSAGYDAYEPRRPRLIKPLVTQIGVRAAAASSDTWVGRCPWPQMCTVKTQWSVLSFLVMAGGGGGLLPWSNDRFRA